MVQDIKKPVEKISERGFEGREIIDDLGRIIKLKSPDVLDEYDLMSALGKEDASNQACLSMASAMLFVASIDGIIFTCPKSYADIRAGIKRIGKDGFNALMEFMQNHKEEKDKKEVIDEIKK